MAVNDSMTHPTGAGSRRFFSGRRTTPVTLLARPGGSPLTPHLGTDPILAARVDQGVGARCEPGR